MRQTHGVTSQSTVPSISPTAPRHAAERKRAVRKLVGLAVFLVAAIAAGILLPLPTTDEVREAVAGVGAFGPILFVLGYGLVTLTPVPKSVVSVAAGLIWGLGFGALLVYVAALLGAGLAFAIGRMLGREAIERFTGARIKTVDDLLRRRGLVSVIGVRLVPVIPFTVINYAASLTAVSRRDYALGTAIGIIPGTVSFVAVGASGFTPGPALYAALGALGLLTLAGVLVGFRAKRRRAHAPDSDDESIAP